MKKILIIVFVITLGFTACNFNKGDVEVAATGENATECSVGGENVLKIVATITLKPGADSAMEPIFAKIVAGSQMEEGCISYDLYKDVNIPSRYVMLEIWKDQAAIDAHNQSDHYKVYKEESKDYQESVDVSVIKIVK